MKIIIVSPGIKEAVFQNHFSFNRCDCETKFGSSVKQKQTEHLLSFEALTRLLSWMLARCFKHVLFQGFGMLSSTLLHSAGAGSMLVSTLCFLPLFVELARKVSAFEFCSIPTAFTLPVLGSAASAKPQFGLISKMQAGEADFTFFTVGDGETFGFMTAVEAGSCSSAAHAAK